MSTSARLKAAATPTAIATFMTGAYWLVVSYEYLTGHHGAFLRQDARIPFVVFDESHALGGSQTLRYSIARLCPADKILLLTDRAGVMCLAARADARRWPTARSMTDATCASAATALSTSPAPSTSRAFVTSATCAGVSGPT